VAWLDDDEGGAPLFEILFEEDSPWYDPVASQMFDDAIFNDNEDAYADLVEYMDWMYDIDFEQEFDWADFYARQ